MTENLTLLAVHAHPDDEASSTGGILARYAKEGITTVLVTCTNGALGNSASGATPEDAEHDRQLVIDHRHAELVESCRLLGVTHLEELGYGDSGMEGWASNDDPDCFYQVPVDLGAARLLEVLERFRPQVVVTYDEFGFYGHPDHIQANRITQAAVAKAPWVQKLYYATITRSSMDAMAERMAQAGGEVPEFDPRMGTADAEIGAVIDCQDEVATKKAALMAHASQTEGSFFFQMPEEVFAQMFGTEVFVRALDRSGVSGLEDDLFAGLR